jgi:site-specific recombinase XerD
VPPETLALLLRLRVWLGGSPYVFVPSSRLERLHAKAEAGTLHADFEMMVTSALGKTFRSIQDGAAEALGIEEWRRGTIHDLRKSFATRAAASGVPMVELHRHLGFFNDTATTEIYTDVEDSAADRLRAAFAGGAA